MTNSIASAEYRPSAAAASKFRLGLFADLRKSKIIADARPATIGAFSLSSNHVSTERDSLQLGGQGWIITPDGEVLGLTSHEQPFVTAEIELNAAEVAKKYLPKICRAPIVLG